MWQVLNNNKVQISLYSLLKTVFIMNKVQCIKVKYKMIRIKPSKMLF